MANQTVRKDPYRYNGAAAYDIYRNPTAPQIDHPPLPDERTRPVRRTRIKGKTAVSPVAFLGMVASICMLVLVIFGYVQLYEVTSQVGKRENELESLLEEQTNLRSSYEGKIDLSYIEQRAAELGMTQPSSGQVVYLNLAGSDKAEIFTEEKTNVFSDIINAIKNSVSGLVEYLS